MNRAKESQHSVGGAACANSFHAFLGFPLVVCRSLYSGKEDWSMETPGFRQSMPLSRERYSRWYEWMA